MDSFFWWSGVVVWVAVAIVVALTLIDRAIVWLKDQIRM